MEHSGMQDFGVSLAGARGSILLPSRDKNSISVLPYQAVPPVHGSIRSIPWAWPGVGEPRQRWELWGERQRSPHSLRGSWEHVEWGRARGCSEQQHPFPAGAGRAEALGMLVCAHVWEGGMKRKGRTLPGRAGGSRTCFGDPKSHEKGSCDAQIIDCSASDNRHKLFPSL